MSALLTASIFPVIARIESISRAVIHVKDLRSPSIQDSRIKCTAIQRLLLAEIS